jgi:adenylate cyclase
MGTDEGERRLAAILSADVAGYSRLMGDDERATVRTLNDYRKVFSEHIARHKGRVVDTAGDSVLAVFGSVVEAVQCAVNVQFELKTRNRALLEKRRMDFRVGINLGDVIEQADGTVYGDGVNVAARLEGVAEPGGITLSESAHMHVEGKIAHVFADSGTHQAKNIARPIKAFAWNREGKVVEPSIADDTEDLKPTVAIGNFENVGQSEDVHALADGVKDAVATTLTNQSGMMLVDDATQADYIASARFQGLGSRYRATVRVYDRRADEHFASERFDGEISDLFESQDELANRIYMSARFAIYDRQGRNVVDRPYDVQGSQALLSQAGFLLFSSSVSNWMVAKEMLETVLAREPNDDMALAMAATCHLVDSLCGYRNVTPENRKAGLERVQRAIRINGQSEYAQFILSFYLHCERDYSAAEDAARRALEINPYYTLATSLLGYILISRGNCEEGIKLCEKAIAAHPRAPFNPRIIWWIAVGYFSLEQFDAAIERTRRSDQLEPDVTPNLLVWITSAANAGYQNDAERIAKRLRAKHPDFGLSELRRWPFEDEAIWTRFVEGLRMAGLNIPDESIASDK